MNIEEKAKAYDNIIEKANKMHSENCEACQMCIEELIPELKESEDERMRKEIISAIKEDWPGHTDWIAWLEKQEQKPTDKVELKKPKKTKFKTGDRIIGIVSGMQYYITEVCDDHYCTESGCIIMFCAQENFELYKQKPAWSEKDAKLWLHDDDIFLDAAKVIVGDSPRRSYGGVHKKEIVPWLLSLKERLKAVKDRVQPQPKQEWSEEDESKIRHLIAFLDTNPNSVIYSRPKEEWIDWLKSLKDRVQSQSQWKPSDEQMKALEESIMFLGTSWISARQFALESLYQDLKKLKGE